MPLRILVADDHPVVRAGLRVGLSTHNIQVVGEAERSDDLFPLLSQASPAVILLDIRLPGVDGLTALRRLRTSFQEFPVVMMTGYDNPGFKAEAIECGAAGYLTKDLPLERFAEVLHSAAAGNVTFTRDDLRRVTGAMATPRLGPEYDVPLTQRECEVLRQLGEGKTNKEIAERLTISFETVKEHVQHILRKIGVVDRTQAVYWGMRNGLIPSDGDHR
jgi:DNA-binding NarL/FixJ family response regulator